MCHMKLVIPLERFRIVAHSHKASFSIKTCLDKTTNLFRLKKAIYLNLVIAYESKLQSN